MSKWKTYSSLSSVLRISSRWFLKSWNEWFSKTSDFGENFWVGWGGLIRVTKTFLSLERGCGVVNNPRPVLLFFDHDFRATDKSKLWRRIHTVWKTRLTASSSGAGEPIFSGWGQIANEIFLVHPRHINPSPFHLTTFPLNKTVRVVVVGNSIRQYIALWAQLSGGWHSFSRDKFLCGGANNLDPWLAHTAASHTLSAKSGKSWPTL